MKRYPFLAFCLCLSLPFPLFAQKEDGLNHIRQLTAPEMYGRGYVNNGALAAERYIEQCFKAYGLQPFGYFDGYKQAVSFPVNVFPDKMSLSIDGIALTPGKDFLVEATSKGGNATLRCVPFDKKDLKSICTNTNAADIKAKYQSKYAKNCLIFDETDSTFTKKEIDYINSWMLFNLAMKNNSIGAILKLTDKKLTHAIAGTCGTMPFITISSKSIPTKKPKTIQFDISQKLDTVTNHNIYGLVPGKDSTKKAIVLTAHYDHLGMMGQQTTFNGANDNASGVAILLTLAKHYSEHQPEQDIVFVALCGEELGLLGSKAAVADFPLALEDIRFLLNIDLVGTGEDGICVVNGKEFPAEFGLIEKINNEHSYFSTIKSRGEACNSDHCPFYKKNVPSFYIYTQGGSPAYHDISDNADQLSLAKFNEYFNLIINFIDAL